MPGPEDKITMPSAAADIQGEEALQKYDGKQVATTSCGYAGTNDKVHAYLAALRVEAEHDVGRVVGPANEASEAKAQMIATAQGLDIGFGGRG